MFTNRILISLIYFSTGFFIPVLSRFLMKFYPCSMHSYFGDILKFYFNKKRRKQKLNKYKLNILKKQYLYNKLIWGCLYLIIFSLLEYLIYNYINKEYPLTLLFILLFLLGFASNIDSRCKLIPDIITFPFLMTSFLIASYTQNNNILSPINISSLSSIYSAIGAYFLCFTLALIFYFKNPYSFGGGDVKLISGISAFVGFGNLNWIFLISFAIALILFLFKKERYVALAPLVFIATIIWLFIKILYNI